MKEGLGLVAAANDAN